MYFTKCNRWNVKIDIESYCEKWKISDEAKKLCGRGTSTRRMCENCKCSQGMIFYIR